jgi:hypothetical protein
LNTVMKLQVSQKAGHFYPTEQLSAFPWRPCIMDVVNQNRILGWFP